MDPVGFSEKELWRTRLREGRSGLPTLATQSGDDFAMWLSTAPVPTSKTSRPPIRISISGLSAIGSCGDSFIVSAVLTKEQGFTSTASRRADGTRAFLT